MKNKRFQLKSKQKKILMNFCFDCKLTVNFNNLCECFNTVTASKCAFSNRFLWNDQNLYWTSSFAHLIWCELQKKICMKNKNKQNWMLKSNLQLQSNSDETNIYLCDVHCTLRFFPLYIALNLQYTIKPVGLPCV